MDYGSETMGYIWTINSGMIFLGIIAKLTHIFFLCLPSYCKFSEITKTLMYSVLTKMRYKKQNWMQG